MKLALSVSLFVLIAVVFASLPGYAWIWVVATVVGLLALKGIRALLG